MSDAATEEEYEGPLVHDFVEVLEDLAVYATEARRALRALRRHRPENRPAEEVEQAAAALAKALQEAWAASHDMFINGSDDTAFARKIAAAAGFQD